MWWCLHPLLLLSVGPLLLLSLWTLLVAITVRQVVAPITIIMMPLIILIPPITCLHFFTKNSERGRSVLGGSKHKNHFADSSLSHSSLGILRQEFLLSFCPYHWRDCTALFYISYKFHPVLYNGSNRRDPSLTVSIFYHLATYPDDARLISWHGLHSFLFTDNCYCVSIY